MESHDALIRIDHVGIAVESVSDAEPVLLALGCDRITDDVVDDRFRWVYYELGNASRLAVIEPVAGDSFLTEYLDANGPGLHHVTLEVADLDTVANALEDNELSVVDRATSMAGGKRSCRLVTRRVSCSNSWSTLTTTPRRRESPERSLRGRKSNRRSVTRADYRKIKMVTKVSRM